MCVHLYVFVHASTCECCCASEVCAALICLKLVLYREIWKAAEVCLCVSTQVFEYVYVCGQRGEVWTHICDRNRGWVCMHMFVCAHNRGWVCMHLFVCACTCIWLMYLYVRETEWKHHYMLCAYAMGRERESRIFVSTRSVCTSSWRAHAACIWVRLIPC